MNDKKYDIVIFGATGFTGHLTAKYIANQIHNESNKTSTKRIRFAIAGRSEKKLKEVKETLKECKEIDTIVADISNDESLENMCRQSRVLMNAVGPFKLYGEPVVKACLNQNCHYLDITGEPAYINMLIQKYDGIAKEKGIKIIPCCGFDSIPVDLGVLYTLQMLPQGDEYWDPEHEYNRGITLCDKRGKKINKPYVTIEGLIEINLAGGVSGGTYHTLLNSVSSNSSATPTSRNQTKIQKHLPVKSHYSDVLNSYVVPFPSSDPAIVKMSTSLCDYTLHDKRQFEYGNFLKSGGFIKTCLFMIAAVIFFILCSFNWGKKLLSIIYKKPGEGPSEQQMEESYFKETFYCKAKSMQGDHVIITQVSGGEPGYKETSLMFGESALCLVDILERETNQDAAVGNGGVVTPARVFGKDLVSRLQKTEHIKFCTKKISFERNEQHKYRESVMREAQKYVYMQ